MLTNGTSLTSLVLQTHMKFIHDLEEDQSMNLYETNTMQMTEVITTANCSLLSSDQAICCGSVS